MGEPASTAVSTVQHAGFDRIEKSIDIDAPASRVWQLIAEPGWFINEGTYRAHEIERDGDVSLVHDPTHGTFRIRTEALDEPRYAAFRWFGDEGGSTLVEFTVEERDGGVTLRVVESGFASLPGTDADRRKAFDGNTEGWDAELVVARTVCTA